MIRGVAVVLSLVLLSIPVTMGSASALSVTFSQERLSYDAEGKPYPCMEIDPDRIDGMQELAFDLGRERVLVVRTNIPGSMERGLDAIAREVRNCYDFVEEATGRDLTQDILLYLFEFDRLPPYYSFRVTCSGDVIPWGEVRMAIVKKGATLFGEAMPENLAELLYDTLPHELGHDILFQIAPLAQDTNINPSSKTRWFIEGICELLAKNFSSCHAPHLWARYLAQRKVGSVLTHPEARSHLFHWAQEDRTAMKLESELYGAALLLLSLWTQEVSLESLLDHVEASPEPVLGARLAAMMERDLGLTWEKILDDAGDLSKSLGLRGPRSMKSATTG